jgi:hypothetical protein
MNFECRIMNFDVRHSKFIIDINKKAKVHHFGLLYLSPYSKLTSIPKTGTCNPLVDQGFLL